MLTQTLVFQAIETRYIGPTNTRPSRIVATADAGRVVVSWEHGLGIVENHRVAAVALAKRFGWLDDGSALVGGSLRGSSMAWVMVAPRDQTGG